MAKVILHPIGTPIEEALDEKTYGENLERMTRLNAILFARREEVRQGWGPEYVDRVHAKGKLTTWERLEMLKDQDSRIFPLNTFVNYGITFGDPPKTSPAAGVITAFLRIHGRSVEKQAVVHGEPHHQQQRDQMKQRQPAAHASYHRSRDQQRQGHRQQHPRRGSPCP